MSASGIDKIKQIINVIEEFDALGLVKNHDVLLGNLLFEKRETIYRGDEKKRTKLIERITQIGLKHDSKKLIEYIHIFFVENIVASPVSTIIDYSDFLIMTKKKKLSIDVLNEIKFAIELGSLEPWRNVLSKILRWPSTDAPESLKSLILPFCDEVGVLSSFGYTVGRHGKPVQDRLKILDLVLAESLEQAGFGNSYLQEWGRPQSISRLIKTARTIAALCRNAKRSSFDYHQAITDWQQDLAYLKETYYDKLPRDGKETWPKA
ncbi:TPA: hypothetical protein QDZ12_000252 [Pseudomonas putida]|nr:hypothetical protein [Pseudomonas putida]